MSGESSGQGPPSRAAQTVRRIGLLLGPAAALAVFVLLPDSYLDSGGAARELTAAARATTAFAVWMAVWWMTEAIPIYATALLPLALFPLAGVATIRSAAAPYGHDLIFLFLGGFIVGLAMERWGLHRRIAFSALRLVGSSARNIVAGFMLITALTSMWVTNTATTIMMLPIALSVIGLTEQGPVDAATRHRFALCLLLGIAYSASIGGIGTLVGTAPNIFLASFAERQLGQRIGFAQWFAIGAPLVITFVPLVWLLLTRLVYPLPARPIGHSSELIRRSYAELGAMSRGERLTLLVFAATALAWMTRPLLNELPGLGGLTDTGVAVIAALALFLLPVQASRGVFVMDWETAVRLPWGLLLLFGGGLSLAAAIDDNGVAEFLGSQAIGLAGVPGLLVVVLVVAGVVFLTELTSNTATTATLVPILAAVAPALNLPPLLVVLPATIAASCAFMLPVATPPNAIVFSGSHVTIPEMARAGLALNLAAVVLITAVTYGIVVPLFGLGPE